MQLSKRDEIIFDFYTKAFSIVVKKGQDYEPSGIAFANLKAEAEAMGVTPLAFLFIHMSKHIAALRTYISTGHVESEDIHERLKDIANYAALFHVLILEKENA